MSLIMNQGGWTGKVLKVDLTHRTATAVDTAANFGQYWGGNGSGYKAIYDAIQKRLAGTDAQRNVDGRKDLARLSQFL